MSVGLLRSEPCYVPRCASEIALETRAPRERLFPAVEMKKITKLTKGIRDYFEARQMYFLYYLFGPQIVGKGASLRYSK